MVTLRRKAAGSLSQTAGLTLAAIVAGTAMPIAAGERSTHAHALAAGEIKAVEYIGDPADQPDGQYQGEPFYGGVFRVTILVKRAFGRQIESRNLMVDVIAAQAENLRLGSDIYVIFSDKNEVARADHWGNAEAKGHVCVDEDVIARFHLKDVLGQCEAAGAQSCFELAKP
jgi:hypothetical protein